MIRGGLRFFSGLLVLAVLACAVVFAIFPYTDQVDGKYFALVDAGGISYTRLHPQPGRGYVDFAGSGFSWSFEQFFRAPVVRFGVASTDVYLPWWLGLLVAAVLMGVVWLFTRRRVPRWVTVAEQEARGKREGG